MCARFTLTYSRTQLAEALAIAEAVLSGYEPAYNIAPTEAHWIVREKYEEREVLPARWGLVNSWAKDRKSAYKQINARAETVDTLPAFREAFKERRCIVPADGFIEWTGPNESRQPLWFHRDDGGLLLFAGLYESWQPSPNQWERTFTIITTTPNSLIAPIHNRMPVILTEEQAQEWTFLGNKAGTTLKLLLAPPLPELLAGRRVSPDVNKPTNKGRDLLEPITAA